MMEKEKILKKLRMKPGMKSLVINAPESFAPIISNVEVETKYSPKNKGAYDYIQVFSTQVADLEEQLQSIKDAGKYDCMFWICYPKGSSKIKSDIKRDLTWDILKKIDHRPVALVAIDDDWSAVRSRPSELVGK